MKAPANECPVRLVPATNGEKGIFILAPMVGKKHNKRRRGRSGNRRKEQRPAFVVGVPRRLCLRRIILVICGRAFVRSMESASATLESPLDSCKHIIAQVFRTVQCIPGAGFGRSGYRLSSWDFRWPRAPTPHQFFNLICDLEERRRNLYRFPASFSAFPRMYR
jgi:hypothetical protein